MISILTSPGALSGADSRASTEDSHAASGHRETEGANRKAIREPSEQHDIGGRRTSLTRSAEDRFQQTAGANQGVGIG